MVIALTTTEDDGEIAQSTRLPTIDAKLPKICSPQNKMFQRMFEQNFALSESHLSLTTKAVLFFFFGSMAARTLDRVCRHLRSFVSGSVQQVV
jgi:hypothetical protein